MHRTRKRRSLLTLIAVVALSLALVGCVVVETDPTEPVAPAVTPEAPVEPDEPLRIRIAHGVPIAILISLMDMAGDRYDILEHRGTEYVIENMRIDASAEIAVVMAAEEADIGHSATGAFMHANTRLGTDLWIVADSLQSGIDGHEGLWFAVREDDDIHEIADLRGRTLGTLGFGTYPDLALRAALAQAGLDPERDVTVVQLGFPAMDAALREGRIDLAQMVQPFWLGAERTGGVRTLFTATDVVGHVQAVFLVQRESFARDNPRRLQAFWDDYLRFTRWALDPANREAVMEMGAEMMGLPIELFDYWGTEDDWFRDPDAWPAVDAIIHEMNLLLEFGIIEETVDIEGWTDTSWVERAAENIE